MELVGRLQRTQHLTLGACLPFRQSPAGLHPKKTREAPMSDHSEQNQVMSLQTRTQERYLSSKITSSDQAFECSLPGTVPLVLGHNVYLRLQQTARPLKIRLGSVLHVPEASRYSSHWFSLSHTRNMYPFCRVWDPLGDQHVLSEHSINPSQRKCLVKHTQKLECG